jgi:hypothetical protein
MKLLELSQRIVQIDLFLLLLFFLRFLLSTSLEESVRFRWDGFGMGRQKTKSGWKPWKHNRVYGGEVF